MSDVLGGAAVPKRKTTHTVKVIHKQLELLMFRYYINHMDSAVLIQQQERNMTYQINIENTGLATDEQAAEVARILSAMGYDVAFTRNLGMVNPSESCPCTDAEWEDALIAADKAFPA